MRETLTEFDILQEAMKKVNLDEEVMPIYNGKVLLKETADAYRKMQLILDTPELHSAHKFIYNLDPEQLSEDEIDQVNKIFSLGVNRGFIEDPAQGSEGEECSSNSGMSNVLDLVSDEPEVKAPAPKVPAFSAKIPCWTVLYSATKNGEIKTGECYSNSIDPRSAKADCIAKLSRCGYENVSILALEQGDPDSCGFKADNCCKATDVTENENAEDNKEKEVTESDEKDDEQNINEGNVLGTFKMTLTLSDVDPETFLTGHVDNWIEDVMAKNRGIQIDKKGMTEDGQVVEVIGSYDALEKIYADYMKYDSIEAFEKSQYDFDEFKDSIQQVNESEDTIKESGNPYAAGLKTTDIGGVTQVGSKPVAKKQKKDKIQEDDEESSDDSESDDSSDSTDDSETDDSSSESDEGEDNKDDDSGDSDDSNDDGDDSSSEDSEEDSSSDDDSTDDSDDSSDDSEDSDTGDSDDDSEESDDSEDGDSENDSDDEGSDDDSDDSSDEDDSEDEDSEDKESDDDDSDDSEDSDDEDDKDDEKKELSDEEKSELKNDYKKVFKDTLLKCKFEDLCFDDLTIDQKVKFFTALQKKWDKNEPSEFMSDKEIEQLNKVVVKK